MNQNRIQIFDILRSFALMGILAANIPGIIQMPILAAGKIGRAIYNMIKLAVEQRFVPIFCLFFEIGFY